MRLTFSWKWVLISLLAFAPVRLLRNYTDLPDAVIWALAGITLAVLLFAKWAWSQLDSPTQCDHVWEPAPQGWHCPRCDRTRRADVRPPATTDYEILGAAEPMPQPRAAERTMPRITRQRVFSWARNVAIVAALTVAIGLWGRWCYA